MIKDIEFPKVKGVSVAITRKINELNEPEWTVYLINKNDVDLECFCYTCTGSVG
ncbi:MAG: hypothetical protein K2Q22_10210 [Cytophagales bacterium]|nr:hypothetical protein [Cytophagales bacterium]